MMFVCLTQSLFQVGLLSRLSPTLLLVPHLYWETGISISLLTSMKKGMLNLVMSSTLLQIECFYLTFKGFLVSVIFLIFYRNSYIDGRSIDPGQTQRDVWFRCALVGTVPLEGAKKVRRPRNLKP